MHRNVTYVELTWINDRWKSQQQWQILRTKKGQKRRFFGHNFTNFCVHWAFFAYFCSSRWGAPRNIWCYQVTQILLILWTSVRSSLPEAAQNRCRDTSSTSEIIIFRSQDLHFSKIYVHQLRILSDLFPSKGIQPVVWCHFYQKWIEIFWYFATCRLTNDIRDWIVFLDHAFKLWREWFVYMKK